MEFINTPVKLEVEEGDVKEENKISEIQGVLTLKEEVDVDIADTRNSVNDDEHIHEPVVANKPTYVQRHSKEKAQQQIASSLDQVDEECDDVSDDWKPRKRGRPRKKLATNDVEYDSDVVIDDCKPIKRSRPRKKVTNKKCSAPQSKKKEDASKVKMRSIGSAINLICKTCNVPPPRIYACDLCEYKAYKKAHLVRHILYHKKIYNFKCDLCPYKSVTKSELESHNDVQHLNIRRFKCTLCTYAGSAKYMLRRHVLKHHADSKEDESVKLMLTARKPASRPYGALNAGPVGAKAGPKMLLCEICGYSTPHTSTMFRHKRRHEGVKRFICDVCSYATDENFKLKRHMKVHKEGRIDYWSKSKHWKNYANGPKDAEKRVANDSQTLLKCGVCNYSTINDGTLSKHKQKHKEMKPFSCEFCSYAGVNNSLLERHLKKHHNIGGKGRETLEDAAQQSDMPKVSTPSSTCTNGQRNTNRNITKQQKQSGATCPCCEDPVTTQHTSFLCSGCHKKTHKKCSQIKSESYTSTWMCPACCRTNNGQTTASQHTTSNNERNELSSSDIKQEYPDNLEIKLEHDDKLHLDIKSEFDDDLLLSIRLPPKKLYKCKTCNFKTYCLDNLNLHSCRKIKKHAL